MTWNRIYKSDMSLDRQQLCWSYTYKVGHVVALLGSTRTRNVRRTLGTLFARAHLVLAAIFKCQTLDFFMSCVPVEMDTPQRVGYRESRRTYINSIDDGNGH